MNAENKPPEPWIKDGKTGTGWAFFALWFFVWIVGVLLFSDFLWRTQIYGLKHAMIVVQAILFAQVSFGFCQGVVGYFLKPNFKQKGSVPPSTEESRSAPTALLFPVYNEEPARVLAGLEATYRSLEKTGRLDQFDFFILSDTRDPDKWVEEEMGWLTLSRRLGALNRIHYRRRRENTGKKAGNIRDFLERWGQRYRYMIIFDADSVMEGPTLTNMVDAMETDPQLGILQTVPRLWRAQTLFGRALQFANRVYGEHFSRGLATWQGNHGNYWGHNAIIRVNAFMEHCDLPDLPYKEPVGGSILSHDFVEAALMRRAGYKVMLYPGAEGSWEEGPENIFDSLQRDRRWCQGNLQHIWFLFAKGIPGRNRIHFLNGILSYAGSLLWLIFLVLCTLVVVQFSRTGLSFVPIDGMLMSLGLDISLATQGLIVLLYTAMLLLGPKFLAWFDAGCRGDSGPLRTGVNVLAESFLSALIAPVMMFFHSVFVIVIPLGSKTGWNAQARDAGDGVAFSTAFRNLWHVTLIGILWAAVAWRFNSDFFWWLSPIFIPLALSIPLAMLLGSPSVGRKSSGAKILTMPEEESPTEVLDNLRQGTANMRDGLSKGPLSGASLAFLDPYVHALHVRLNASEEPEETSDQIADKMLSEGISSLSPKEIESCLNDPKALQRIHRELWFSSRENLAPEWRAKLLQYSQLHEINRLGFNKRSEV
ncbi:glucans biosynthesis glucosyltransferase MdoH [Puniceicoccus vermicola]|uniref:Glucans biosynthesis glucosyltransferase H n=1 Tax=Puniceicoccus vermicola TaxID=388746 RepID=A0A7X1AW51_9BACT|nr:glucans biosynthesis glucosyltransferase MdoH [Puniceicoccus vermicola]MBC2600178.1 glucans biosynthesis glucosyltransferase MdoH [Puniceicoccus vermicola]